MLHVDLPARAEIERLARHRGLPAVSIYLRTTPLTAETRADRTELKNLLRTAMSQMEDAEVAKRAIWPIAGAVEALIDDDGFWAMQANSLAIFAEQEGLRTYRLANRLTNRVEVSDRFHLKPLIRAVSFPHDAYVLAIGMGAVRLVEVSADLPPHKVAVPNLPRDMAAALGTRRHTERTGEMRSGEQTSEHALLSRYARAVDGALRPILAGQERPLIVAAAEPLASIYRGVSSYPFTAGEVIAGSADHTPDHTLAEAARGLLDGIYATEIEALRRLWHLREGQGRATTDVSQAARAATFGAIDTLLVDMDASIPGTVADEDGRVTFADGPGASSYGIIDEIARRALLSGARILSARRQDIPGEGDLAAILRYAF